MSRFSCAFFRAASFLLALLLLAAVVAAVVAELLLSPAPVLICPLGLKLVSLFFDLDSRRPVPRMALKSRSTDSCRVDFGDFVVSVMG